MRLPDRQDLLDYVEHASGQDAEVHKRILHLLASSQILREHMAELKRDLYVVAAQIPDYTPAPAFGADVMRLSQTWVQMVYERKFSARHFYRSREFFGIILSLLGLTFLVLAVVGYRLLGR